MSAQPLASPRRQASDAALATVHEDLARLEGTARADAALAPASTAELAPQVKHLREVFVRPPSTQMRRLFFLWFRVWVRETKKGKVDRVNVRIPIPIPLIGLLFPRRMSQKQAFDALEAARRDAREGADPMSTLGSYADSAMAFELVRVHEEHPERDHYEQVVIGFD